MQELATRSRDILDAVVRLNIETGRPVSSGLVERSLHRGLSSATIRNEMKSLERAGYLQQPHPSAGRHPTDRGFRSFVDRLQAGWALRPPEIPVALRRVAEQEQVASIEGADRIKILARLLSRLTDNIGIILGPSWDEVRAVQVDLIPRSRQRVLMVVILDNTRVRSGTVELSEAFAPGVLEQAAGLLTQRIRGRTVAEIRAGRWDAPDLIRTPASRCATHLARAARGLLQDLGEGDLGLDGVGNVLDEPEFREPEPLKELLRFIESPRTIRGTLDRLAGGQSGLFGVWIGAENPEARLRRFAVVTRAFEIDGRPGTLAILGPRRMAYQRAFQALEILSRLVRDGAAA